ITSSGSCSKRSPTVFAPFFFNIPTISCCRSICSAEFGWPIASFILTCFFSSLTVTLTIAPVSLKVVCKNGSFKGSISSIICSLVSMSNLHLSFTVSTSFFSISYLYTKSQDYSRLFLDLDEEVQHLRRIISFTAILLRVVTGCSSNPSSDDGSDQSLSIYTSIYPLQYAAEQIAGNDAVVTSIYPR